MKLPTTALVFSGLLASALASPSAYLAKTKRQDEAPAMFRVIANKPDTDIDSKFFEARGRSFWLGGKPSTYCPTQVGDACPPGKITAIAGLNSLAAMVPGGQQLYVETSGAMGFTQAHLASVPPGALVGFFEYVPGDDHASYIFTGWDATGFMACPDTPEKKNYQVFANISNATVPTGNRDDCIDFDARVTSLPPPAWQYV